MLPSPTSPDAATAYDVHARRDGPDAWTFRVARQPGAGRYPEPRTMVEAAAQVLVAQHLERAGEPDVDPGAVHVSIAEGWESRAEGWEKLSGLVAYLEAHDGQETAIFIGGGFA